MLINVILIFFHNVTVELVPINVELDLHHVHESQTGPMPWIDLMSEYSLVNRTVKKKLYN